LQAACRWDGRRRGRRRWWDAADLARV